MIKTPKFWKSINIISLLLYPISLVYRLCSNILFFIKTPKRFSTKIICVGNAIAGGSGKTPSVIMLVKHLKKKGYKVSIACKNYKASIPGPVKVTTEHTCPDVVEEALLLSQVADTFTAHKLYDAISLADMGRYDFIITDDGLQNNSFKKDISILVINGEIGTGNNFCLPAGPLRETLDSALSKSDYVFFVGKDKHNISNKISKTKLIPVDKNTLSHPKKNTRYIAFTGIAHPELFFKTLKDNHYNLLKTISFPDHHVFSGKDIQDLLNLAGDRGAKLITTAKDHIKIKKESRCKIDVLPIEFNASEIDCILSRIKSQT